MGRRTVSLQSRELYDTPMYWDFRQAQYIHPGGYTNDIVAYADATPRYIAVPPVGGSANTFGFAGAATTSLERPMLVEFYRDENWYLALDRQADTQNGAFQPGGIMKSFKLNPGVDTISFVAATGTTPLRINWGYGL